MDSGNLTFLRGLYSILDYSVRPAPTPTTVPKSGETQAEKQLISGSVDPAQLTVQALASTQKKSAEKTIAEGETGAKKSKIDGLTANERRTLQRLLSKQQQQQE